jgi:TolB-like protein/Tfp pilus assembly protein PilF
MSLFIELKRRNVLRVAAAYVVAAWLVIQVVETLFPVFGLSDAVIRIVVIVLGIGLVPVVVFAWAFELTPEGLKKESDVDRSQSVTLKTGKKLDRMIMVVLAMALVFFAFDKFVLDPARDETRVESARQEGRSEALTESYGERSIAVLSFDDMSPEGDQEYFADGISEELLNLLAKIPELRVAGRTSAFSYKGKDTKITQIGEELNVAHILEGSVRKAGNQVRITAQLIEARSDTHLWSETYDRTLDNIFAIQDEISAMVVEQLKIKLLGDQPKSLETDPEAFALFLQARHLRRQGSAESLEQARVLFEQVLETAPDYLPALDDLITVYINQAHSGERPFNEAYEHARSLTTLGLELDPESGRMYAQLGWIEMFFDGEMQAAADHYEIAVALAPSDMSLLGDTASILFSLGRLDKALALSDYTRKRDPVHPVSWANHGNTLLATGRWEEAAASYRTALALSPDYSGAYFFLSQALLEMGDSESALTEAEKETMEGYRLMGLSIIHHAMGDIQASDEALDQLISQNADHWDMGIAQVLAMRGDIDGGFKWIEAAIIHDDGNLAEIHINQGLRNLHQDPRWVELLARLGKSPEQLAAIRFNPDLPE